MSSVVNSSFDKFDVLPTNEKIKDFKLSRNIKYINCMRTSGSLWIELRVLYVRPLLYDKNNDLKILCNG
ncbi:hypothetical protein HanRHA438_Chr09g0373101 [Helianthus annuus]|uniref:Uncharacterized protein n=1 Tax=Helianthus annuus TaxID=4232 RepID=A0A9K3I2K4_HELAN|nr:hypothetical protein HanXRQr2_Chr09g0361671 [Helianthus annuus]KAJ0885888.1 hypothetical protein HanRHA438_Chr09g0373101 [Helianthus annuus]